jgi:AcrR family transcriptional regulator
MKFEGSEHKIPRENKKVKAIISASQTLFANFGYKKTTVDEIARTANVAKGTMYKYFDSKDDIFAEVVNREANHIINLIEDNVARENDPIEKIRALILVKIKEIKNTVSFYRVTREVAQEIWPIMAKVRQGFTGWECGLITGILEKGINAGQFKITRPDMVAGIIATILKSLELNWVLERETFQLESEVDQLMEVLLWGIAGRK